MKYDADDLATLRRAVEGETLHPFTMSRLVALGWANLAPPGAWLWGSAVRHDLTPAGEAALAQSRGGGTA